MDTTVNHIRQSLSFRCPVSIAIERRACQDNLIILSDDDRQAADQINRRTEFQVLRTDYGLY